MAKGLKPQVDEISVGVYCKNKIGPRTKISCKFMDLKYALL
jgi:hypothetical protein